MKFFRTIIPVILLLFLSLNVYSQFSITSYSVYAVGVNTNKDKRFSGELKIFANRDATNLMTEVDCYFNFTQQTYHRFSAGVGLNFEPFKDYDQFRAFTLPLAVEITPFKEVKCISFLVELTPEFVIEDRMQLRHLWGIRYTFGKK